jgi:hypothetical protein
MQQQKSSSSLHRSSGSIRTTPWIKKNFSEKNKTKTTGDGFSKKKYKSNLK